MIFFSFQKILYKKFYSYVYGYYKKIINLILYDNKSLNKYLLNNKNDNDKNDNHKNNNDINDNHKNDNLKKIIPKIQKKYCYLCFSQIENNTYCVFDKIFCTKYCRDKYINSLKIN